MPNEARWIAGPGVQGESDVPQRLIGGKVGALDTGVPVEGVHRPVEGVDRSTGVDGTAIDGCCIPEQRLHRGLGPNGGKETCVTRASPSSRLKPQRFQKRFPAMAGSE